MRELLIAEFGSQLRTEVKNDAFLHIAFKKNETLVEFSNQLYDK